MIRRRNLLRAPLGLIACAGSGGTYSGNTDPRLIHWYEARQGFGNLAPVDIWGGPLQPTSGSIAAGPGLNGNATWGFNATSGGFLQSSVQPLTNYWYQPWTRFTLIRDTGSTSGASWWSDPVSSAPKMQFSSAAQLFYQGVSTVTFAAAPNAWHLYEVQGHSNQTRVSIDGGPYIVLAPGVGGKFAGVCLGAGVSTGGGRSTCELALDILYEGQATLAFKQWLYSYIPSVAGFSFALPAPQPVASVAAVDSNFLLVPPFDIIPIYGQSNNTNNSTVATTSPAAGILCLNGDNTITQMGDHYTEDVGRLDEVAKSIANNDANFGNGGALANTYQASTGRQLVTCPSAVGGASIVPGTNNQRFQLQPGFPRDYKLRNSPYGSLVQRVKNLQNLGGRVRWLWHYQGENEASESQAIGDQWPAATLTMWQQFFADVGMAGQERVIYVQIAPNPMGPNWANFRTNTQPLLQVAGKYVMVSAPDGPYEPDGLHLEGTACNVIGALGANAALAAGW